jgi:hypothetical protein
MIMGKMVLAWTTAGVLLLSIGCAGVQQRDIESQLIDAFRMERKTVEIKDDAHGKVYMIDPLHVKTKRGCELALIRVWEHGIKIDEKEVEVCGNGYR